MSNEWCASCKWGWSDNEGDEDDETPTGFDDNNGGFWPSANSSADDGDRYLIWPLPPPESSSLDLGGAILKKLGENKFRDLSRIDEW